ISQSVAPRHPLADAVRIAQTIEQQFAGDATDPIHVATALGVSPTSTLWQSRSGAAVGYGLTSGAYNAKEIRLTELGTRIVAPLTDGDSEVALREAALVPKSHKGFLEKYNRKRLPSTQVALNV